MLKKFFSVTGSVAIAVVFLYFLLREVAVEQIIQAAKLLPLHVFLFMFVIGLLGQFLRSVRLYYLLDRSLSLRFLFPVSCVHNALANTLPFRSGEFSFVYLVKKYKGVGVGHGLSALVLSRVFDLLALMLIFFVSVVVVNDVPGPLLDARPYVAAAALFVVVCMLFILFAGHLVERLLQRIARLLGIEKNRFVLWFIQKVDEAVHAAQVIKKAHLLVKLIVVSVLLWFGIFIVAYALFNSIGLELTFPLVVVASSISSLLMAIPIQGFLGFGTSQAFWALSLVGTGVDGTLAIQAGFVQHLFWLLYLILTGAYGYWHLRVISRE